jgi:glycosyltransferase involved in cell wall biosynthesis
VSEPDLHLLEVGLRWPPETFVGWKLKGLAARGMRVTVASPTRVRRPAGELTGVECLPIPHWEDGLARQWWTLARDGSALAVGNPSRLARLLATTWRSLPPARRGPVRLARRVRPMLRLARETPDVVHFEWESAVMAHLPLLELWDCPVVVSCHGAGVRRHPHSPRFPNSDLTLRAVFERASVVHCVADAVLAEAERYGLDRAKARVIRTAVDPQLFAPNGGPEPDGSVLRVVSVSRLIWSKGHEYALLAVRRLMDLGVPVHYELVGAEPRPDTGEASDLPRILHTIEDLGLGGHVHLAGGLDSDGVRAALRRSHVFLHASVSDGLPTVIAEAMACGLPAVVSDVGGVRELVRDGVEGFVLPAREPARMAQAMRDLWEDPDRRVRMAEAARERIRSRFAIDGLVGDFDALYRELAGTADEAGR